MLKSVLEKLAGLERRRSTWLLGWLSFPEREKPAWIPPRVALGRNEAGFLPPHILRATWVLRHAERKEAANPQRMTLQA
jgi:hypothetical protein